MGAMEGALDCPKCGDRPRCFRAYSLGDGGRSTVGVGCDCMQHAEDRFEGRDDAVLADAVDDWNLKVERFSSWTPDRVREMVVSSGTKWIAYQRKEADALRNRVLRMIHYDMHKENVPAALVDQIVVQEGALDGLFDQTFASVDHGGWLGEKK